MPRLLSVNVGLPRDIAWRGETVRTAIWKEPVQGQRMVRRLNIDGDKQGDLAGHGGEQRAIFVLHHYAGWTQVELADHLDLPIGTVKSRLHYATKTLRAAIAADARTADSVGSIA